MVVRVLITLVVGDQESVGGWSKNLMCFFEFHSLVKYCMVNRLFFGITMNAVMIVSTGAIVFVTCPNKL